MSEVKLDQETINKLDSFIDLVVDNNGVQPYPTLMVREFPNGQEHSMTKAILREEESGNPDYREDNKWVELRIDRFSGIIAVLGGEELDPIQEDYFMSQLLVKLDKEIYSFPTVIGVTAEDRGRQHPLLDILDVDRTIHPDGVPTIRHRFGD